MKKFLSFALMLVMIVIFAVPAIAANDNGNLTAQVTEEDGAFFLTVKYESNNNSIKAGYFEVLTADGSSVILATEESVTFSNKQGSYSFLINGIDIPANAVIRMTEDKGNKPVVVTGVFEEGFTFINPSPVTDMMITVNFDGFDDVTVKYYTTNWYTVGTYDDFAEFDIPEEHKNIQFVQVIKGGMSYTFSGIAFTAGEALILDVPTLTLAVYGIAAECNLGVAQADWVYRSAPASVGAVNYYEVFDNDGTYKVSMSKAGFHSITAEAVRTTGGPNNPNAENWQLEAYFANYFYQIEIPENVSNVWISSNDWAVRGANAGDKIALVNTGMDASIRFEVNGETYNVSFTLDGDIYAPWRIKMPAEIPSGTSVNAKAIALQDGTMSVSINITADGSTAAFGVVSIAPNSCGVFSIGDYEVYVSTENGDQIYAVIADKKGTEPEPDPTGDIYLVRNASYNTVNVGTGEGSPSPSNGSYAIWWDNGGSANNPNGTSRYIQFEVTVPSSGWYQLDWMWYTRGNDMYNNRHMSINGDAAVTLPFRGSQSGSWEYFPWKVQLEEGLNTIKIWWWQNSGLSTNSWLILDHLKVTAYNGNAERVKFWSDFADVLTLGSNLSIADAGGINAALAAYDNLTGAAQALLADEKALLDILKAKIIELEIKHDDILSDFGFEDILALNITSLKLANADRLYAAILAYNGLPENDKLLLTVEKALLDTLKARMELLEAGNTDAIMLEDWMNAYLKDRGNGVYSTYLWSDKSSSGEETGFWQAANVYELLNDAYEATNDPYERAAYKMYMDGYRVRFLDGNFSWSGTWKNNEFTDDLLWWSNAFIRTYMLTGDESYLAIGEEIFEYLYARAWDTRTITDSRYYSGIQGGLLWKFNKSSSWTPGSYPNESNNSNEKNIATNGNGTIAAARLARIYDSKGDTAKGAYYANVAYEIYDWMYKSMVADYSTGKLWDNYQSQAGKNGPRDWQFSYNYGLFAGAAYEMWVNTGDNRYLADAKLVLNYGWTTLTMEDGLTFKNEGGMDGGDGASFRLVFARYTGLVVKSPEFAEFEIYMLANAYQTWSVRRSSDGLVGDSSVFATDAGTRIPSPVAAYGVLMQLYSDFDPNITYGFEDDLVVWKVGYSSLEEAAGDKIVNMNPIFIQGGSGFGANEGPAQLFDYTAGGTGTKYGGNAPYWAEWRYDEAFVASRLIIATANDNMSWPRRMGDGWTLQGSNDGASWEPLYTGSADDYSNFNRMFYSFDLAENTTEYSHYRLYSATGADGGSIQLSVVALASDS